MEKLLSFCITCKNRLWQIERTLIKNLEDNIKLKSKIEFVLVDFNSNDGLGDWVKERFKMELKDGYLKYYFTNDLPHWHASIGKNTAHLFANGKILTNLDCDNFTGQNGAQFILDHFGKHKQPIVMHQFSANGSDGSFGRISVLKDFFYYTGGYDEAFYPMGFQDADLIIRLWMLGLKYVRIKDSNYSQAIRNTKSEGLANCNSDMTYEDMNMSNRDLSFENISRSKNPVRNNGVFGIHKNVYDYENIAAYPAAQNVNLSQLLQKHNLKEQYDSRDLTQLLKSLFS